VGGNYSRWRARGLAPRGCLTAEWSTVEGRRWSRGLRLHGELLEEKLVADGLEGGEERNPLDESLQMAVAGDDAMQKV
jgi:hypothetical protein